MNNTNIPYHIISFIFTRMSYQTAYEDDVFTARRIAIHHEDKMAEKLYEWDEYVGRHIAWILIVIITINLMDKTTPTMVNR